MKSILLGGVALMVLAGAANAADMARMPLKAPPPPVVSYDWTGFYLGGYWGSSIGQSNATAASQTGSVDISKSSWTAGGTLGANWQFSPNWLLGFEGDLGYLANNRSFQEYNDPRITVGVKPSWYGTVRGRVGYVTGPSLLYVTGGAAFVRLTDTWGGDTAAGIAPGTVETTKTGWTVGGGIETKLSRNWSQKTEYLYVDAGSTSFATNSFGVADTASFKNQFHVIKSGINYKFGGPDEPLPFFAGRMLPTDHNWAGFYAGVNVGGGLTTSRAPANAPGVYGDNDMRGGGFTGGVQLGYNIMNLLGRPYWFVGIEGDIGYLGINTSHDDWFDSQIRMTQKTDWYGTVRGRIGTTTGPALLYVTGGAAFVHVEDGVTNTTAPASDVRFDTKVGWTLGGGTEVALNSRWSAKLEYLYIDAGKSNRSVAPSFGSAEFHNQFSVIRAGLNYKFGGDDLVRARY